MKKEHDIKDKFRLQLLEEMDNDEDLAKEVEELGGVDKVVSLFAGVIIAMESIFGVVESAWESLKVGINELAKQIEKEVNKDEE